MGQDNEEKAVTKESIQQITYNVFSGGKVFSAYDNALINEGVNQSSVVKAKQKIKSRTQEYAEKWNSNMFLNDFDKYDENAGINVKLSEVYLDFHLPHYIWGYNRRVDSGLKEFLSEYINEKTENKMLLILGQPGIGKSTLITWITVNFVDKIDNILVYRFTDLKNIDWHANNISNRILEELGLSYKDLKGKILVFDGFDEINVKSDRKEVVNSIYRDLIKEKQISNFSILITCRENYIEQLWGIQCKYITLQSWDERQIRSFCAIFQEKTNREISKNTIKNVFVNKEILGVPLILYMVMALNISIEKEGSIVDVYDKIFSLEGGIYDRCIDNKSYEDPHWIEEIKRQIHQISRDIAIWMFENNSEKTYIQQGEYQNICDKVMNNNGQKNEDMKQDFLIGNYFRKIKHCEGVETEEIYFVHRSIYEYFVAETIYNSIEQLMFVLNEKNQEKLAGNIAWYIKQGKITYTIGEYLKHKILKSYNKLDIEERRKFYQWWENMVNSMMNYGMFYYTKKNIKNYRNIIKLETRCFVNLLKILKYLLNTSEEKYILKSINKKQLERYIKHYCIENEQVIRNVDLSKTFLEEIDLTGINLIGANLEDADLARANLIGGNLKEADLTKANLKKADLKGVDLKGANLKKADLKRANLKEADLKRANLKEADLRGANLETSIWLEDDIQKIMHLLNDAKFEYIIIKDENEQKKVYRRELFPDEIQ